jgi:hypothetical protein
VEWQKITKKEKAARSDFATKDRRDCKGEFEKS